MAKITLRDETQLNRLMLERMRIRQEIVSQMWDLWITITFPYIAGEASTISRVRKFFDNINRNAKAQLVDKRIHMFMCIDEHNTKEGCHAHLFVKGIKPEHAGAVKALLSKMGRSDVEPYDPNRKAAGYVACKHATKNLVSFNWFTLHPKMFKPANNNSQLSVVE